MYNRLIMTFSHLYACLIDYVPIINVSIHDRYMHVVCGVQLGTCLWSIDPLPVKHLALPYMENGNIFPTW